MNRTLTAVAFDGLHADSLGHYLAGLGLLAAASQRWPTARGCWRNGRFTLVSHEFAAVDHVKAYLLTGWKPTRYERWWSDAQKLDTKAKSSQRIWHERNRRASSEVRLLDAHIVGTGRNHFNPVLGTGGNIGKRDLAKAWNDALRLLSKPGSPAWLQATLSGDATASMPAFGNGGTWFVFANKMYNSGQAWFREGQLSPWSQLLAMEGAFLLVGGANRRLGSRARPYAVFPFISEPIQPDRAGEIGLARAEFWAPLWACPATLAEVKLLLQRGMARIGGRPAQAPHEFAVAAMGAGADAGVEEFARYELRQTTSAQVFEAIPRERIRAATAAVDRFESSTRSCSSKLLTQLIATGWLDRLPYEPRDSKQRGKFVGLRGPIEAAIVRIGEQCADERWQALLLQLAIAQTRIDLNKQLRERCLPVPLLPREWFDMAWPNTTAEIEAAVAVASLGWRIHRQDINRPFVTNVFGVELSSGLGRWNVRLPQIRPMHAVWATGDPLEQLLNVGHRRLVDGDCRWSAPFSGAQQCSWNVVSRLLRNDGSLDLEVVAKWIPALSLIDWSQHHESGRPSSGYHDLPDELDGTALLHALARPLFHAEHGRYVALTDGTSLFAHGRRPRPGILRRVFNLLRHNAIDEAVEALRNSFLAVGRRVVELPVHLKADGPRIAAALLFPLNDSDVSLNFQRWLQPTTATM